MIHYKLRSRAIVDIVKDIEEGNIILSPFFQRNLVWRIAHKVDFIKTILEGYPFPEIFMSRGTLDLETRRSTSFIVDGQQRMNSIKEFSLERPIFRQKMTNLLPRSRVERSTM